MEKFVGKVLAIVAAFLSFIGCTLFRPNPLDQNRGALVLVFDTRTAGNLKTLRGLLSTNDVRATFFVAGRIQRHMGNQLKDMLAEGHEIGLSGLKGVDAQLYSTMYGQQKYFQDEIVAQVLDAERQGLNPRYYLLKYPAKQKAETLKLPSFLVSKGFARVVDVMPDYIFPTPVRASAFDATSTSPQRLAPALHAYQMTSKTFSREQLSALVKRREVLVIAPDREVLPDLLEEARVRGIPFATLSDLKK